MHFDFLYTLIQRKHSLNILQNIFHFQYRHIFKCTHIQQYKKHCSQQRTRMIKLTKTHTHVDTLCALGGHLSDKHALTYTHFDNK